MKRTVHGKAPCSTAAMPAPSVVEGMQRVAKPGSPAEALDLAKSPPASNPLQSMGDKAERTVMAGGAVVIGDSRGARIPYQKHSAGETCVNRKRLTSRYVNTQSSIDRERWDGAARSGEGGGAVEAGSAWSSVKRKPDGREWSGSRSRSGRDENELSGWDVGVDTRMDREQEEQRGGGGSGRSSPQPVGGSGSEKAIDASYSPMTADSSDSASDIAHSLGCGSLLGARYGAGSDRVVSDEKMESVRERFNAVLDLTRKDSYPQEVSRQVDEEESRAWEERTKRFLDCAKRGDVHAVVELLSHGVNVNVKDEQSSAALHFAAQHGMVKLGKVLIEHGAHVDCRDKNHWTPLHVASKNSQVEMCVLLLNSEADVSSQSQDGNVPLHYFARCRTLAQENPDKYLDTLLLFLKCGADVKVRNRQGETPLHEAAFRGTKQLVRMFIKCTTADVNCCNNKGETPLHYAVRANNHEVVELLLAMGADQDIAGVDGTAQQVAVREGRSDLMQRLSRQNRDVPKDELCGSLESLVLQNSGGGAGGAGDRSDMETAGRRCDEYGFILDHDIVLEYDAAMKKTRQIKQEREKAWKRYVSSNDVKKEIAQNTQQLKSMIRKGVASSRRAEVWFKIAEVRKGQMPQSYYKDLRIRPSPVAQEIEKDIPRTYPGLNFFSSEAGRQSLRNVLHAYSMRNPSLGYCQSMNFLAGLLLLFMPEERAFWVLCYVVEDLLEDYFVKSMIGLSVDQRLLEHIVEKRIPKVYRKLDELMFPLSIVTTRWHMCVFLNSMPTETILRIWDVFLLEGADYLLLISFYTLKMHEVPIVNARGTAELMSLLANAPRRSFDPDRLLRGAAKYSALFEDKNELLNLRVTFWSELEYEAEAKRRDIRMLQRDRTFFEGWSQSQQQHSAHTEQGEQTVAVEATGGIDSAEGQGQSANEDDQAQDDGTAAACTEVAGVNKGGSVTGDGGG